MDKSSILLILAAFIVIFSFLFIFQVYELIKTYKIIKKQRSCLLHKWKTIKNRLICEKCGNIAGTDLYYRGIK